jgi:acetyl esterase/lipase
MRRFSAWQKFRPLKRTLRCLIFSFLALALSGCTKFDVLSATIPPWGYERFTDIPYGPQPRQKLDVYRPTHGSNPAPIVVFFYGGSWQSGSKADYRFVAQALASRGFVAVLPDYRLYPPHRFPVFVEDGALAVRWAHDHAADFGGDPRWLHLMGHSAGAHIAALLTLDARYLAEVGLDRSAVRSTAALSGPYDFIPAPDTRAVFNMPAGDAAAPDPRIEPINFVDGRAPPMLLLHGLKDDVVAAENAFKLAAAITAKGGQARWIAYPRLGHAGVVLALAAPFRWLGPVLDDVTRFFGE